MKIKLLVASALVAGLLSGCATEKSQAELQAEAKISKAAAEQTALTKVPNGTIKEGELEKEHGRLIWSFDITTADSKNIKEVAVDAISGDVISVDMEIPVDQAKEAAEDAAKKKADDKEDKD